MVSPLTHFGIDNLENVLNAFSSLGQDILSGDITDIVRPINSKSLRYFKMKEVCKMVGRSDAFLRKLEKDDLKFTPKKENKTRLYSLDLVNKIRDKANTRYTRPAGSSPIVIAVSNFKGGVGKSITSKSLADKLAISGLKVCSIGMDGQGTDSLYYGLIPELDITPDETIRPVLLEDPKKINSLIRKTYFPGIDIIPGNLSLTEVEIKLTDYREQMGSVKKLGFPDERLSRALEFIKYDYDVILLDCGPNLNILTLNAINACNAILVPVPPALPDLASFCTFCKTLKEHLQCSDKSKDLEFFRILITKHPKNKASTKISNMMIKEFGSYVMPKDIVYSAEIELAGASFSSLYELQPSSKATYMRAMNSMDDAFNEIVNAFKLIWDNQSKYYGETKNAK